MQIVIGYLILGMALTANVISENGGSAAETSDVGQRTSDNGRWTFDVGLSTWDACMANPPEYYAIKLVSTKRLPGTRMASGKANVTFAPSPYGVHISPNGTYVYDISIEIDDLKEPEDGMYVVWLTTPNLKQTVRLGALQSGSIEGRVDWNKFLVVVTLEEVDDPDQERWAGPIAMRGLSRSGFMHTMAGHGPFNQEPCAFYGYE